MKRIIVWNVVILVLLAVLATACGGGSDGPKDVARKALDATMEGDPETFDSLVAPDRRARVNQGEGLALAPADVFAFQDCEGLDVEYLVRETDAVAEGKAVTLVFAEPCIDLGSGAKSDSLTMIVEKVNDRWYLNDVYE